MGLLLLLPILLLAGCKEDLPAGAIAQVGTQLVSQDTYDKLISAYQAAGKAPSKDSKDYDSFKRGIAEYLVTLEVLRQEASTFKVSVTDKNVQDELATIKEMFQGDEAKFEAALEKQHLTLEQFTQSLTDSLWLDKMKAAVTQGVAVSDDEAQQYYQAHKAEYVEQESREVRHILISPFQKLPGNKISTTATQAEWDAAKSQAEKVRSEILNGADFVTEAEKYSDDTSTADSGGDLGAVVRGQMVPDFEQAVFSLQKGDISNPVRTQYGYHIIEVTDITPEQQTAFDQVKETIKSSLLEEKQTATWNTWLADKEAKLGVIYRKGYAPTSTTPTTRSQSSSTTTAKAGSSGSSSSTTSTTGQ